MSFNTLNKAMIMGRLGRDPEAKTANSGTTICNFSLATSESFKKGDEWEEKTEWHKVVVFGKQAENTAKYCKKGSLVFVEGRIQTRSYQDKDGNDKYITEIVGNVVRFLDSKDSASVPQQPDIQRDPVVDLDDDDDDIGF